MERFKRILRKLLFPGAAVVLVSIPVAAVLLVFCAFAVRHVLRADEQLGGVKRAAR